jgi:hypothetical protein
LPMSLRQYDGVNVKDEVQKRKYVELDKNGKPQGKMVDLVKHDVHAFTKELDPNLGWEKQKDEAKNIVWTQSTSLVENAICLEKSIGRSMWQKG